MDKRLEFLRIVSHAIADYPIFCYVNAAMKHRHTPINLRKCKVAAPTNSRGEWDAGNCGRHSSYTTLSRQNDGMIVPMSATNDLG
jgi:hypothetical protein